MSKRYLCVESIVLAILQAKPYMLSGVVRAVIVGISSLLRSLGRLGGLGGLLVLECFRQFLGGSPPLSDHRIHLLPRSSAC
jgi:hypothetical protein